MSANTTLSWATDSDGVCDVLWLTALVGRPTDVNLASFVKAGAYYSEDVEAMQLFACTEADMEKRFKREGVGMVIYERVCVKYKPSDNTLSLSGCGEIVL